VGSFAGARDCAALALDASLNVKVTRRLDDQVSIRYFGENGERVPRGRSNFVVRALEAALRLGGLKFTGADFEIYSSVPVAVGLGSSTAAVLAGLIAARQLFDLALGENTIFELASAFERRADNLRAGWWGGFVASACEDAGVGYRRTVVPENFSLHVVVPAIRPPTAGAAREIPSSKTQPRLAWHTTRADAFFGYFSRPGSGPKPGPDEPMVMSCEKNLPGLEEALRVRTPGMLSVFVCGSGPAVGVLASPDASQAVRAVRECFAEHGVATTHSEFRPMNAGARDWNAVLPHVSPPPARGLSLSLPRIPILGA
jgi:homoserine kinase